MKKEDDEIPIFNRYECLRTLTAFAESDKLLESELSSLECYTEYQLEASLNSFNDHKLNNHLYIIYSTKRRETVKFMRQLVGFYVCQHRTKMTERVKDYLETKNCHSMDGYQL